MRGPEGQRPADLRGGAESESGPSFINEMNAGYLQGRAQEPLGGRGQAWPGVGRLATRLLSCPEGPVDPTESGEGCQVAAWCSFTINKVKSSLIRQARLSLKGSWEAQLD